MAHSYLGVLFLALFVLFTMILWMKHRFRPHQLRQTPHQDLQEKMEQASFGCFVGPYVAENILAQTVCII